MRFWHTYDMSNHCHTKVNTAPIVTLLQHLKGEIP